MFPIHIVVLAQIQFSSSLQFFWVKRTDVLISSSSLIAMNIINALIYYYIYPALETTCYLN